MADRLFCDEERRCGSIVGTTQEDTFESDRNDIVPAFGGKISHILIFLCSLVEDNDIVFDDGVAPELAFDFDCQHNMSSGEAPGMWAGMFGIHTRSLLSICQVCRSHRTKSCREPNHEHCRSHTKWAEKRGKAFSEKDLKR